MKDAVIKNIWLRMLPSAEDLKTIPMMADIIILLLMVKTPDT